MKKIYLLALPALLLSAPSIAVEHDSVYTWGKWANGLQPAAGPVASVTPPPAQKNEISFRPNENDAFFREAATSFRPAPPAAPGAPQIPDIVIAPSDTVTTPRGQF
ncbi:MAG TPA: hypothetical protein ENJ08_00815 [Gammaproteobacteria bacterium]|nr:hypothetical protein [Gammaproteobacteria bacterium]